MFFFPTLMYWDKHKRFQLFGLECMINKYWKLCQYIFSQLIFTADVNCSQLCFSWFCFLWKCMLSQILGKKSHKNQRWFSVNDDHLNSWLNYLESVCTGVCSCVCVCASWNLCHVPFIVEYCGHVLWQLQENLHTLGWDGCTTSHETPHFDGKFAIFHDKWTTQWKYSLSFSALLLRSHSQSVSSNSETMYVNPLHIHRHLSTCMFAAREYNA